MGRHTTNAAAALHEPLAITISGDAVAVGDYVRAEASGLGRRAVDGLALATQNTGAGVTALAGLGVTAHMSGVNYSSPQSGRVLAVLGSGNVAYLYTGDGATANTALTCRIYSPIKALVTTINVSGAVSIASARVFRLNASNFAVVWTEGSALKMAVYTNAGVVVLAVITIATIGANAMTRWNAAVLANGDLALAYDKPAAGGMFFSRYNTAGVLQGAETTIEAATAADYVCVLPLAAGGFWVYYFRATAVTAYKFARYNAAGALQGALTTVFTGASNLGQSLAENYAAELSNGNVALIDPSVNTVSAVRLYDSAGTFLTTVTNNTALAAGAPNATSLRAKTGGGLYICALGGLLAQYDNAGNLQLSVTAPGSLSSRNEGVLIDRVGLGPLLYYGQDSAGTGTVSAVSYSSTLVAEATSLVVQVLSSLAYGLWAELMPCGLLAYAFTTNTIPGVVAHGRLAPQAASVLGLAITAGSDGQAVTVATAGRWRANQSMAATSFDRRSSAPVGCKAVITGGTSAVLLGIVA